MQQELEEITAAYNQAVPRAQLQRQMHALAEAQYAGALPLFVALLGDSDWDWRLKGVRLLGFHYPLDPTDEITGQLRQLLLTDGSEHVRMSAAAVLGVRSQWRDDALVRAVQHDPDDDVRKTAFLSLLMLAGLTGEVLQQVEARLMAGEVAPTIPVAEPLLRRSGVGARGET